MSQKPLGWVEFRKKLGEALQQRIQNVQGTRARIFIQKRIDLILDVDYEGPPICGGEMTSLHCVYEEVYLRDVEDYCDNWSGFEDHDAIHDWLIDSHPGLCPSEIAFGVEELIWGEGGR